MGLMGGGGVPYISLDAPAQGLKWAHQTHQSHQASIQIPQPPQVAVESGLAQVGKQSSFPTRPATHLDVREMNLYGPQRLRNALLWASEFANTPGGEGLVRGPQH